MLEDGRSRSTTRHSGGPRCELYHQAWRDPRLPWIKRRRKSTTVKMLTGLMEPSDGQILYEGRAYEMMSRPYSRASATCRRRRTFIRIFPDGNICNSAGWLRGISRELSNTKSKNF